MIQEWGSILYSRQKGALKSYTRQYIFVDRGGRNQEVILGIKQFGYCKIPYIGDGMGLSGRLL